MGFFDKLFGKAKAKKNSNENVNNEKTTEVKKSELDVKKSETKAETKSASTSTNNISVKTQEKSVISEEKVEKKEKKASVSKETNKSENRTAKESKEKKNQADKVTKSPAKEENEPKEEIKLDDEVLASPPEDVSSDSITGRFEINRSKDGKKYFFNLYASNKVGIATSQMYSSAQSALIGIKSVIANAATAPIEDQTLKKFEELSFPKWIIYIDKGGKYRFHLCAANGTNVCHSQGYTTKGACKNGIDSIIRSSRNAEIDKTYLSK